MTDESEATSSSSLPSREEVCKKRRQYRADILRQKRRRLADDMISEASSTTMEFFDDSIFSVTSTDRTSSNISADQNSGGLKSEDYKLTPAQLRKKKNRESAERSRLRKLHHIDYLTAEAAMLCAAIFEAQEEQTQLRINQETYFDALSSSSFTFDIPSSSSSPSSISAGMFCSPLSNELFDAIPMKEAVESAQLQPDNAVMDGDQSDVSSLTDEDYYRSNESVDDLDCVELDSYIIESGILSPF